MNNKENSIKRLGSKYMILLSALLPVFVFSVQAASPPPVADGRTDMLTAAHSMSNVTQPVVITEYYTYQYDNAARLSAVTHRLNNGSTVTLTANTYDALGRITQDSCNGSSPLLTSLATSLQPVKPPPGNLFTTDTVSYCGNVVFGGDSIRYILVDGGYVTSPTTVPEYHFYLRDHLGSNRVVCSATGAVEQKNHSYPYGMPMDASTNASRQPYKYNGKELVRSAGLNWLDYGARWHDPILGRWQSMDGRCEDYYSISPYAYCAGDPVNAVDTNGDFITYINSVDGKKYLYYNGNFYALTVTKVDGHYMPKGKPVYVPARNDNLMYRTLVALRRMSQSDNKIIQHVYETVTSLDSGVEHVFVNGKNEKEHNNSYTGRIKEKNTKTVLHLNNCKYTDYENIGHEIKHQYDYEKDIVINAKDDNKIALDEYSAVNFENLLRAEEGRPLRKEYDGYPIPDIFIDSFNLDKNFK